MNIRVNVVDFKPNTHGSQANHALTINLDQSDEAAQFWVKLVCSVLKIQIISECIYWWKAKARNLVTRLKTKAGWHGPEFEFPTLRIPFRKQKFTDDVPPFLFLIRAHPCCRG